MNILRIQSLLTVLLATVIFLPLYSVFAQESGNEEASGSNESEIVVEEQKPIITDPKELGYTVEGIPGGSEVIGDFVRGEVVSCVDSNGSEVARGLVNYSAVESRKIKGQPSGQIESLLGYVDEPELIHRDNLVLL